MLFNLEPYIPFNVFVVFSIFVLGAIVCWGDHRDNRKDGE